MTDTITTDQIEVEQMQATTDEVEVEQETDDTTFPRAYVEKLRHEAAEARVKAKRAEEYAQQLLLARVAATGRLADPTDLAFDLALVEDPAAMNAAIDTLLATKPHLASRTPRGSIGQGVSGTADSVDLAALLRRGA